MLSVNENECDRTSDRIHSVFDYKKSRKEHLNGKPAYGYISDENKQLIKDPATEHIVNDIFEYYFSTYSKKATVHYILEKYADSPECPTMYQVNRILKCETYTGTMYGIVDYCPAYITKKQFHKIRTISDSKIIPHQTEPFIFSSMIRCPICGKNMNGFVKREKLKSGSVSEYKRYRCGAKFTEYHNGACLSETVVEAYLIENVSKVLQENIVRLDNQIKKQMTKPNKSASIRAELERLNNMYQKGRIKEEYYDEQYAILTKKLEEYSPVIELTTSLNAYKALSGIFSHGWQEMYRSLDISHKKAFWKEIIKDIEVDAESRKVCGFNFRI